MAVGSFGVAFLVAFTTQAQNGFSNRWNKNLRDEDRSKIEKYIVYALEYLGFIVRAGVNIDAKCILIDRLFLRFHVCCYIYA